MPYPHIGLRKSIRHLPPRRVSFSTTPPTTPIPNALSYATIASSVDAVAVRSDDACGPSVTVPARRGYPVLQNSRGQRLDAIISPPQSLVKVLRDKKLCNPFHILGECPYPDCIFLHGVRLDEKGIEARRLLARQAPCSSGLHCEDEKCLFGHQCPDRACARIGRVVVLHRRCTVLIGVEVGHRWFVGSLVRSGSFWFVSSFWCETEVPVVSYCTVIMQ